MSSNTKYKRRNIISIIERNSLNISPLSITEKMVMRARPDPDLRKLDFT